MRESAELDDLDLLLVTALQTAPRATWQQLGQVLGVTASTAARRWERLTGAGLAWLSCHPRRLPGISAVLAVIGVNCVAIRLPSVAATVAEDPHVFNVSHVTGFYDLVVIAAFTDQISLGRYLRFRVGWLDGVQSVRVHIVTDLHTEGSQWRLDRLQAPHRAVLLADRPTPRPTANADPDAADLALMTALRDNPRQSAADLARSTRLSTTSVRRRLIRLDTAKLMAWRCDVARCASGWPVAASFWGVVPPDHAAEITNQISRLRETRFCASLSGPDNLLFTVWLRSLADLQPFEILLAKQVPDFAITARNLILWQLKLGSHILDPHGRCIRSVPMALWPEHDAVAAEHTLLNSMRFRDTSRAPHVGAGTGPADPAARSR